MNVPIIFRIFVKFLNSNLIIENCETTRLAEAALLKEAQRGAVRAQVSGPSGWLRNKLPSTNKVFLHNTIAGAVASNKSKDKRDRTRNEDRKRKFEEELKEKHRYKKVFLNASTKPKSCTKPNSFRNKIDNKEVRKKTDKILIWDEENGLEIKCSNSEKEKCSKTKKSQIRSIGTKNLPRNIKFVSSHKFTDSIFENGRNN
ncbi:unnamed protein product, partial [Meganyctiphanes norvegica]